MSKLKGLGNRSCQKHVCMSSQKALPQLAADIKSCLVFSWPCTGVGTPTELDNMEHRRVHRVKNGVLKLRARGTHCCSLCPSSGCIIWRAESLRTWERPRTSSVTWRARWSLSRGSWRSVALIQQCKSIIKAELVNKSHIFPLTCSVVYPSLLLRQSVEHLSWMGLFKDDRDQQLSKFSSLPKTPQLSMQEEREQVRRKFLNMRWPRRLIFLPICFSPNLEMIFKKQEVVIP